MNTALNPQVVLKSIELPDFGEPTIEPETTAETYQSRMAEAMRRTTDSGLDALLIYGDREHASTIRFLSGYDPRFEEALLIALPGVKPLLLVGNEGWGYCELAKGQFERVLYRSFSLMGQPRDSSVNLKSVLDRAGIQTGHRVGVVGWKHYDALDGMDKSAIEIPAYIVDTLREVVSKSGRVENAGAMFADPDGGMRTVLDVDELARMEHAATYTSQGLRNVLFGLKEGMSAYDAVRLMQQNGLPQSAHTMLTAGPRASYGLPSPSHRKMSAGEPVTMAYCVWGSLTSRAGFVASSADDLPNEISDYVARVVAPYYSAAVAWYEALRVGVTGDELYTLVHQRIGDSFFGVHLNPGHLIHDDEWVHSPIYEGSKIELSSGMALQLDIIPATGGPYFMSNVEDGMALADAALREEFATRHPEAWGRITARRNFMKTVLGIQLSPDVLPFSNIPAYLPPYWLSPHQAMVVSR